MSLELEQRIKSFVVDTPSIRRRKVEAIGGALMRAEFDFQVARLAANTSGTLNDKTTAVAGAIKAGLIKNGSPPCAETVRQRASEWNAGKQSVEDYLREARPRGPRSEPVPLDLVTRVRAIAAEIGPCDIAQLVRRAEPFARERGYQPLTAWRMRRVLAFIGQHTLTADRHGSRAAEMDAMPRHTYPVKHAYDRGALDEGDSDHYAKAICRVRGIWVSVRPSVIVTRDHRSGLPTCLVVDPTRRIDKETNTSFTTGFDGDDVLAALLGATVAELAPEYIRDVVGLFRELVWDNAPAHHGVERRIFDEARVVRAQAKEETDDLDDDLRGIVDELPPEAPKTTFIPVRRPDKNGLAERMVGVVKPWSKRPDGNADICIPLDRIEPGMDLGRERSEAAASGRTRRPRRKAIAVEDLPTIEGLQAVFDEVLKHYSTEHRLKRHGYTPLGAARKYKPSALRSGHDLVRMLDPQSFRVQREGIVVERDGRRVAFEAVDNGVLLQIGATAIAYVDPYLRALWLEQGGRALVRLRPKVEADAELNAADIAHAAAAAARSASDRGAELRADSLDAQCGPGTAARAQQAYELLRTGEQTYVPLPAPAATPPHVPTMVIVDTTDAANSAHAGGETARANAADASGAVSPGSDGVPGTALDRGDDHVGSPVLVDGTAPTLSSGNGTAPHAGRSATVSEHEHGLRSDHLAGQPGRADGTTLLAAPTGLPAPATPPPGPSSAAEPHPPSASASLVSLGLLPNLDPDLMLGADPDADDIPSD
jgi:hypothetical protein